MSNQIKLFINNEELDLTLSSLLKTANYESSLKVEQGGFTNNIVRGSGYNKAGQDYSFSFWISSYENKLLDELNKFVSKIVYYPGSVYYLLLTIGEDVYRMNLTAPKISKESLNNLKTLKVTLTFSGLNNYFVAVSRTDLPVVLVDNVPNLITINSYLPVEYEMNCNVKIVEGGQLLFIKFGDFSTRFIQISQQIPAKYAGVCRLKISSTKCTLEDLDLSANSLGTLPIVAKTASVSIMSNTLVDSVTLSYYKGATL